MKTKGILFDRGLIVFFLSLLVFGFLFSQSDNPVYIKAGKIFTSDRNQVIENGGMLIEGRKILKVEKKVKPPKNAQIIDLGDKVVIPGLFDAHTFTGFHKEDFSVRTEPPPPWRAPLPAYYRRMLPAAGEAPPPRIQARYKASDAVYYGDSFFKKSLVEGITAVKISIPTDYLVGGISFCAKLASSSSDFVLINPAGVDFSLDGEKNVMKRYGDLKKVFNDAIEYRKKLVKYRKDLRKYQESKKKEKSQESKKKKGKDKEEAPAKEIPEPKEPRKNENHEVILQILARKIPAMIRASRINEIRAALKIKEEFRINLVLIGGFEAYKIADELLSQKVSVIAGPQAVYVKKGRRINYIKELLDKNIPVAFGSGSSMGSRFLPFQLAYAVHNGLTEVDALNVLTANAAQILGVEGRVGSLASGKDADFVVLNGNPFDLSTRVERVYINGRLVYSNE